MWGLVRSRDEKPPGQAGEPPTEATTTHSIWPLQGFSHCRKAGAKRVPKAQEKGAEQAALFVVKRAEGGGAAEVQVANLV